MEEILEEYGEIILGLLFGAMLLSGVCMLLTPGGLLEKLVVLFGNTAC